MSRSVIAEIGINHDGDKRIAERLVRDASRSGCHGIKFQYRNIGRTYGVELNEIGDEILQTHISKSFLSPGTIVYLRNFAIELNLKVGISFFDTEDIQDFGTEIHGFNFFKVPSVELLNEGLIDRLISLNQMVYLSTGMHNEEEIISAFSRIEKYPNWMPLHCISNYPLANHNVQLGQITHLNKWNRGVGYSSHDSNWENCIAALTLGATVIERHITYSKSASGLDHSSSSDFQEFSRICKYAKEIDLMLMGNSPRIPNQGELLNRQNLGRSFYATQNLIKGQVISNEFFDYRSPQIGLNYRQLKELKDNKLLRAVPKGQALVASHLLPISQTLNSLEKSFAAKCAISIPIRLNDHHSVRENLPTGHYEFHLSYGEIKKIKESRVDVKEGEKYSVHLPDYISHDNLIDPWSKNKKVRHESLLVIEQTMNFANTLAILTDEPVPVVASFAGLGIEKTKYFNNVSKLLAEYSKERAILTLQWLPPIAWYFGGSIELPHVNSELDAKYIADHGIPLTLDSSHLILGKNVFGFNPIELIDTLKKNIAHVHLADASGFDGEGLQFSINSENSKVIEKCFTLNTMKVIEVWQGHLDDFSGFKSAIKELYRMRILK